MQIKTKYQKYVKVLINYSSLCLLLKYVSKIKKLVCFVKLLHYTIWK